MFIAYTDASVKGEKAFLGFIIFFEDNSKINRRIIINDVTDSNIAEGLAINEFLSFVQYYKLKKGLILFDSNGVKSQLKKKGRKIHKYLPKNVKKTLQSLQIRTQVIPRKWNLAHTICYRDRFLASSRVSDINRSYYSQLPDYPEYFLQPSVLEEYRSSYKKTSATFHEAQTRLNKKIWLADLLEEEDDVKVYVIHDRKIKVHKDTIVKISKVNHAGIGNHWRVKRRRAKLKKILDN